MSDTLATVPHQERLAYLGRTHDLAGYAEACEAAHRLNPGDTVLACHYAEALGFLGHRAEKMAHLRGLLARQPQHPWANMHLGWELLAEGRYLEGWPHYAYRTALGELARPSRDLPDERAWKGEPLAGKALLILTEQGLGDTIQFARAGVFLQRFAVRPVIDVQPALRPLFAASPAIGRVLETGGEARYDYWARLFDLVPSFARTIDEVRWPGSYLAAPAGAAPVAGLGSGAGLRVGLAWSGNPGHPLNGFRSVPPGDLARLAEVPGCRFLSLMPAEATAALAGSGDHGWIADISDRTTPFEELARVIAGLDVVVSVCTSIAHLAGAMGKPTLLMLSAMPDWRWGRRGETTPWYPSVRIFRQKRLGDWGAVLDEVAEALAAF